MKSAEEDRQPRAAEVVGDDDPDRVLGAAALTPREDMRSPPAVPTTRRQRNVPQHREQRGEPDDDAEDRGRDVHADAEAEEERPGDPGAGAVVDVDEQALLRADAAGRERQQGREALHGEDEQRVVQARRHAERLEEEVDRGEAEDPRERLPRDDLADEAREVAEDRESLADALLEVLEPPERDHEQERADDEPDERDDQRLALVAERVAPVDLRQVGEDVEAGEDADRQRPGEDPGGDDACRRASRRSASRRASGRSSPRPGGGRGRA